MSPTHTDAQRDLPKPSPRDLATQTNSTQPEVYRTERDRIVTDAILEDV
jgi:hypothetical protein